MPFRYRRSFKVLPGLKLNVGKKSHSWTVGGRGAHTTYNPVTKKTTQSFDTPIDGLYWSKQYRNKSKKDDNDYANHDITPQVEEKSGKHSNPFFTVLGVIAAAIYGAFELILLLVRFAWSLLWLIIGGVALYLVIRLILALL